jgi:hypothetical protein
LSEQTAESGWPEGWRNPTSKKGWVNVAFDQRLWIPCPPGFPEGYDLNSWAATFADGFWQLSGLEHTDREMAVLSQLLKEVQTGTYGHIACHLVYIHLPDPRIVPLPVFLGIWEAEGDRDRQLRMLIRADDPKAVEPPIVEEVRTEKLGAGLRTLRYMHMPDGGLYAAVNYAWRSEEFETDLQVWASTHELGRLQRAIPDIEEFVRAIAIVPKPTE